MGKTHISGIPDCTTRRTAYSDELLESYWRAYAVFGLLGILTSCGLLWQEDGGNALPRKTYGRGLQVQQITSQALWKIFLTILWIEHPQTMQDFDVADGEDDKIIMSNRFRHRFDRFVAVRSHSVTVGIHDHDQDSPNVHTGNERWKMVTPYSLLRTYTPLLCLLWSPGLFLLGHSKFGNPSWSWMPGKYHGQTPQLIPYTWTRPQKLKPHSRM